MQIFSKMIVASSVFLFASLQTQLLEVFLKRSRRLCISSSKSSSKKKQGAAKSPDFVPITTGNKRGQLPASS